MSLSLSATAELLVDGGHGPLGLPLEPPLVIIASSPTKILISIHSILQIQYNNKFTFYAVASLKSVLE